MNVLKSKCENKIFLANLITFFNVLHTKSDIYRNSKTPNNVNVSSVLISYLTAFVYIIIFL